MKLVENSTIEEQGNRLVNSKAKSPTMSPKKIIDNKFSPMNKFNLGNINAMNTNGMNKINESPVKNTKLTNLRNF